ncbi:unnamed protein product, partial [Brenthis ino]
MLPMTSSRFGPRRPHISLRLAISTKYIIVHKDAQISALSIPVTLILQCGDNSTRPVKYQTWIDGFAILQDMGGGLGTKLWSDPELEPKTSSSTLLASH